MLDKSIQKIIAGMAAGAVISAVSPLAIAKDTGYLMTKWGEPVVSKFDNCVRAPKQPHAPLEACGDITTPEDSDGDGVPDDKDKCPNNTKREISAGVNADGCPKDTDGDGVPDYRDRCPNTPKEKIHKVNADGCAPMDERGPVVIRQELGEVNFDTDKASLRRAGKDKLKELSGKIKNAGSTVKEIRVNGHADERGGEAYNQKLSERRAKSVSTFLQQQGVSAGKMIEKGFGESQPKCTRNRSASCLQENRRVNVDIIVEK